MLTLDELVPIITDTPPLYTVTCVHPPVARPRDLPDFQAGRPATPYMVNDFDKGDHTNNPIKRLSGACRRPSHYAQYITSAHCCACQFSVTRGYPCRHMWRVLSVQNILHILADVFHPRCATRFTLSLQLRYRAHRTTYITLGSKEWTAWYCLHVDCNTFARDKGAGYYSRNIEGPTLCW